MKTDELVSMLAEGVAPVDAHAVARRFALALAWGVPAAFAVMAIMLGLRPDLAAATRLPMFWVKLVVPAAVGLAALVAAQRLGRPGMRLGGAVLAIVAPVAALWLMAGGMLAGAEPGERPGLVLGSTWRTCPFNIAMISLPLFVAAFWAMKGLAPTRLALAGAGAGLLGRRGGGGGLHLSLPRDEGAVPRGLVRAGDGHSGGRGSGARAAPVALVAKEPGRQRAWPAPGRIAVTA